MRVGPNDPSLHTLSGEKVLPSKTNSGIFYNFRKIEMTEKIWEKSLGVKAQWEKVHKKYGNPTVLNYCRTTTSDFSIFFKEISHFVLRKILLFLRDSIELDPHNWSPITKPRRLTNTEAYKALTDDKIIVRSGEDQHITLFRVVSLWSVSSVGPIQQTTLKNNRNWK